VKGSRALLLPIALLACVSAVALLQDGSEAGTTHIDGNWTIDQDTTLSNGTWWVDGCVEVEAGALHLDHAELVVNDSRAYNSLIVDAHASLHANDSVIRGGSVGVEIIMFGEATFLGCTLTNPPRNDREDSIRVDRGSVTMERCLVENGVTLIYTCSGLTMRGCRLSNFTQCAVRWWINPQATLNWTVLIEDTAVEGGIPVTGIGLSGRGAQGNDGVDITVRNCTFTDCGMALWVSSFLAGARILIEGNVASGCRDGIMLYEDSSSITFRSNTWCCDADGAAMTMELQPYAAPAVERDRLLGDGAGLRIYGMGHAVAMVGLDVDCGAIGIDCTDVYLTVNDSVIQAGSLDVRFDGYGWVHLRNCTSDREGQVLSDRGEIVEYADLLVKSVSWQEGTPITSGSVCLYNSTGHVVGVFDLPAPRALELIIWRVTLQSESELVEARAYLMQDGLPFFGDFIPIRQAAFSHVIIYDRFVPSISISSPHHDEWLGRGVIVVSGGFSDRGVGMGTIEVSLDGGGWAPAMVMTGWEWSTILDEVPNGMHGIEARATDRAGNTASCAVPGLVMDATPPPIEILQPGPYTQHSPTMLVGWTEAGARVTVNGKVASVDTNGVFKVWTGLQEGLNEFRIDSTDEVGNANGTVYWVTLDTVPPGIVVELPLDGSWTWSTSVVVRGRTDEVARVTVNGAQASVGDFFFLAVVNGTEGPFSIDITAVDQAMNINTTCVVVNIDQTPPAIGVASPADGLVTASPRILVVGTVSDVGEVALTLQGEPIGLQGGVWQSSIELAEGWNVVAVTAEDAAGNRASRTFKVQLDTTSPTLEAVIAPGQVVLPGLAGTFVTGQGAVRVLVKVDEWGVVRVTGMPDVEVPVGDSEVDARLSPGRNVITVNFTDLAGNGARGVAFEIVRDVVPPELLVTSPKDGARTVEAVIDVVGGTEPGASLTVDGEPVVVDAAGGFRTRVRLEMGENTISVLAKDRFGNAANMSIAVERLENATTPQGRRGVGLTLMTGLLVGVLAVLVVMLARTRGRPSPKGEGPTGQGPAEPSEAPEAPEAPRGVGVKVRRGR